MNQNLSIDAYAAGLLDGEGCIWIGEKNGIFYIAVQVGMSEKAINVLKSMQKEYGGTLLKFREKTDKWDAAWTWSLIGEKAAIMLRRVKPYLRLKEEQAQTALQLQEIIEGLPRPNGVARRWTEEGRGRAAVLKKRMSELNRRGPSPKKGTPIPGYHQFALLVGGLFVTPQRDLFSDTGWVPFSGAWPSSGIFRNGECWTRRLSAFPNDAVASSLSDILEKNVSPRYCLSPKAAAGILRRAAKRGRSLPARLREALEALAGDRTTEPTREPSLPQPSQPTTKQSSPTVATGQMTLW